MAGYDAGNGVSLPPGTDSNVKTIPFFAAWVLHFRQFCNQILSKKKTFPAGISSNFFYTEKRVVLSRGTYHKGCPLVL